MAQTAGCLLGAVRQWPYSAGKLARKSGFRWLAELKGAHKRGLEVT